MININKKMQNGLCLLIVMLALSGCSMRFPVVSSYRSFGNLFSRKDSVTVKKGDTLYSISRKYQVPIRSLISMNHIVAPYTVYVGQRIKLPTSKNHEVKKGETLYSISRKYGVDLSQLAKHNNIASRNNFV